MVEVLLRAQDHFGFAPGIKEDVWFWATHGGTSAKCRFFRPGSKNLSYRPWFDFSFSFNNKPEARNATEILRSQEHKRATGWKKLDPPATF